MFPSGPNGERLGCYEIVTGCEVGGSIGQAENMARLVREKMKPAPKRAIEEWLAELSVIVAKRQDDEFTEGLRLEAYSSRLAQYPADVAKDAVLGRSWRFWPTWAELEKVCDVLVAPRKAMLEALEKTRPFEPPPERERICEKRAEEIIRKAGFAKRIA